MYQHNVYCACVDTPVTTKSPDSATRPADCSFDWERKADTSASGGVFLDGVTTESACKAACIASPTCAAIDLAPIGCVLHNDDDLADTQSTPGVTQFVLDRRCPPTSTESPPTTTTSVGKTTGMSRKTCCVCLTLCQITQRAVLHILGEIYVLMVSNC